MSPPPIARDPFVGAEKYTEVGGTICAIFFTEDRGGYRGPGAARYAVVAKLGREATH